jgi:hypothetical protein
LKQCLREQAVIAIPEPLGVQWTDEQIRAFQPLEHGLSTRRSSYRVANGSAKPIKNGRVLQEATNVTRLSVEHILHQVIDYKTRRRSGEFFQETVGLISIAQ